jgi:hypothetical protein
MTRSNKSRNTLMSEGLFNNRRLVKGRTVKKRVSKEEKDESPKDLFKKLLEIFGCT